jgi:hypothetical protein
MTRILAAWAALAFSTARADDGADRFAGEWKTTLGPVTLEAGEGGTLTGRLEGFGVPVAGRAEGRSLAIEYDEGPIHVEATWTLEPGGLAFTGASRGSNGARRAWNGWRPDPEATRAGAADFSCPSGQPRA